MHVCCATTSNQLIIYLSTAFIPGIGNSIYLYNITAIRWTSAEEIYQYLRNDKDACNKLLKVTQQIRQIKHSTIFARHPLLYPPIPLYGEMTPQELRVEIAHQTTLHLRMYSI